MGTACFFANVSFYKAQYLTGRRADCKKQRIPTQFNFICAEGVIQNNTQAHTIGRALKL